MKFLALASLALAAVVRANNVIDLDTKNFEQYVGGSQPALVEVYAPWCGHCKNLAPTYEQLADAFPSSKVVIAKTNADGVGRELGSRYGVSGYPTIKWFPAGSTEPVDYQGGRDLDSLVSFVAKESGQKSKIKAPPPGAATELTASNFDDIALNADKNVLVAFTAPWCGHCKNMKPAYEKVAKAFSAESDVVVGIMNADDEENKPVAARYEIRSFPTIKFFPKGNGEPVSYQSGRTEDQFIEFLNEHCGTHRTATGLLGAAAGKVLTLDTLASNFFSAGLPERPEIVERARQYLGGLTNIDKKANASAEYYVKAMERIVEKGESWLVKEQARIAGLLGSPSLASNKLDELKVKSNILSSFVASKVGEAYHAAADVAGQATDSIVSVATQATDSALSVGAQATDAAGQATDSVKSVAGQATDSAVSVAGQATESAISAGAKATDAVKGASGQTAEGMDAIVDMIDEQLGGRVKGEL